MPVIKHILQIIAWEGLNPYLLKRKQKKRYNFPSEFKGINLGCGLDNPEQWLGIDGGISVWFTHEHPLLTRMLFRFFNMSHNYSADDYLKKANHSKIIHHDCTYGIPLDDNSVPAIYSSHFFEHLPKTQAQRLISECYRVLKPNGIIRICVPSLDEEVERMRSALREYPQNAAPLQRFVTSDIVGFNSYYSNHRWMYNFYEMKSVLESAGFLQVCEKKFKTGDITDVDLLDTRGGLHVEAKKSI